ncbi:MAG: histidine kinase [Bacteroidota bacterium]
MAQLATLPPLSLDLRLPRWAKGALYVGAWTVPGLAALSFYYLNQIVSAQPLAWTYGLTSTLPNWYFWGLFAPVIVYVVRRFRVDRDQGWRHVLLVYLPMMVAVLALHAALNLLLFRGVGIHDTLSAGLYEVHFTTRFYANVVTFWTVVCAFYAYDYYQQLRQRERETSLLQLQLAEANLRALRMQLHPHFMFNTLHAIAALVRKNENGTAVQMLGKLGEFLRLALENKDTQEVPLQQELTFLEKYLALEKVRFQHRLKVTYDVAAEAQLALLPNLVLQPLVENAIKYGIAPHAQSGQIAIRARRDGTHLVVEVADDGPVPPSPRLEREGIGLSNTRARLRNLYGDDQAVSVRPSDLGGWCVALRLPWQDAAM